MIHRYNRRHPRAGVFVGLTGATLVLAAVLAAGQPPAAPPARRLPLLPYQTRSLTLGTVTCASSLCHGSVTEWKGSHVRQDEYIIWSRTDRHARATLVLLNERSRRIASNLGLPEPAHKSKICLDCHAHNPDSTLQGPRFKVTDGIACEACHGPAERWVASHTAPEATHSQNLANGLYSTAEPLARARLCLSCHLGNTDRFVTHRMMGAGHPRMSFELDTFSSIGPAHFTVDEDYRERKGSWDEVKFWAIGQAVAVSQRMDLMTSPRGRDGLFPELVLFDCHACHHPMSEGRWKPKTAFGPSPGPGVARLNESNMLMLRAIARQVDAPLAAQLDASVSRLSAAVAGQGDLAAEAMALRDLAEHAAARIEASSFGEASLRDLALTLLDEGLAGHYSDYAAAEQASMAIGSVASTLRARGLLRDPAAFNRALGALRDALANDETFKPAEFQKRLLTLRALVDRPRAAS